MLNVNGLKAAMVLKGYTSEKLAKELGITTRTLSTRFKTGDFGTKEIEIMVDVLSIEDPMSIFFAKE